MRANDDGGPWVGEEEPTSTWTIIIGMTEVHFYFMTRPINRKSYSIGLRNETSQRMTS